MPTTRVQLSPVEVQTKRVQFKRVDLVPGQVAWTGNPVEVQPKRVESQPKECSPVEV